MSTVVVLGVSLRVVGPKRRLGPLADAFVVDLPFPPPAYPVGQLLQRGERLGKIAKVALERIGRAGLPCIMMTAPLKTGRTGEADFSAPGFPPRGGRIAEAHDVLALKARALRRGADRCRHHVPSPGGVAGDQVVSGGTPA